MSAFLYRILVLVTGLVLFLSACHREAMNSLWKWKENQQLIVIVADGWRVSSGTLWRFQYGKNSWHWIGNSVEVSLGAQGLAWGRGLHPESQVGPYKREGDRRSPAGIFRIGPAFGYARVYGVSLPFQEMQGNDFCIDQPQSPYYNQIVDRSLLKRKGTTILSEPMRRDLYYHGDQLYKLGFVIRHNEQNVSFGGSCIFAHLRMKPDAVTAGCTAMDEQDMKNLLSWLDVKFDPVLVLLPISVYKEKQGLWNLPVIRPVSNMK